MKNKIVVIIIWTLIMLTIFLGIGVFFVSPIDESIKNINWYSYNVKNGEYSNLYISNDKINLLLGNSKKCNKYYYNSRNKTIRFDCGIKLRIIENNENYIKFKYNDSYRYFFKTIDESINYEFNNYFNMTMSEYDEKYIQSKEIIKIDYKLLSNIEDGYYIFMGDNCSNLECHFILSSIENFIAYSPNVYFIDSTDFDTSILNKLNSGFPSSINNYNDSYPVIYKVINNKVEKYVYKCYGFDCSKWNNWTK